MVEFAEHRAQNRLQGIPEKKFRIKVGAKACFAYVRISHWVWDTFAEPNNFKQYRVKLLIKIRPHPPTADLAQKAG